MNRNDLYTNLSSIRAGRISLPTLHAAYQMTLNTLASDKEFTRDELIDNYALKFALEDALKRHINNHMFERRLSNET